MSRFILPIDTKSLYYNIKNDNFKGHTATVSTCIVQGNTTNKELMNIYKINKQIHLSNRGELIDQITKNSKSSTKINNLFVFKNIKVNGIKVNTDSEFAMYIKEEIDSSKKQFGRIKLHYPISLKYEDLNININNKDVINKVSETIHNYAFIVNAFEYDSIEDSLNFMVTIVGENQVPYSKVFINNKGVGNKFSNVFNEYSDSYDIEIMSIRKHYGNSIIEPEGYKDIYLNNQKLAYDICRGYLLKENYTKIRCLNEDFSNSIYDFECQKDNIVYYIQLYFTATSEKYFNISSKRIKFLNDFSNNSKIVLITKILDDFDIYEYTIRDIDSFSKTINSMMLREEN